MIWHIIDLIIACLSILLSYLVWRDRKKTDQNGEVSKKLEKINDEISAMKSDHKVLEERVNNEIKSLDKVSDKIDKILQQI